METEYERATDDGRESRAPRKPRMTQARKQDAAIMENIGDGLNAKRKVSRQVAEGHVRTIRSNADGFAAAGYPNAAARAHQLADDVQARIDAAEFRRGS